MLEIPTLLAPKAITLVAAGVLCGAELTAYRYVYVTTGACGELVATDPWRYEAPRIVELLEYIEPDRFGYKFGGAKE